MNYLTKEEFRALPDDARLLAIEIRATFRQAVATASGALPRFGELPPFEYRFFKPPYYPSTIGIAVLCGMRQIEYAVNCGVLTNPWIIGMECGSRVRAIYNASFDPNQ